MSAPAAMLGPGTRTRFCRSATQEHTRPSFPFRNRTSTTRHRMPNGRESFPAYGSNMGIQVVRLEAWCDFVDLVGPQLTFRISEFAVLADGRRVLLHDQRGFTTSTHRSGHKLPVDPWGHLTLEELERSILTTVLPDDAEETGEQHPWDWLSGRLGAQGVNVRPEELRPVPYVVVFSERLRKRVLGA